jgi:hypothetical protein
MDDQRHAIGGEHASDLPQRGSRLARPLQRVGAIDSVEGLGHEGHSNRVTTHNRDASIRSEPLPRADAPLLVSIEPDDAE